MKPVYQNYFMIILRPDFWIEIIKILLGQGDVSQLSTTVCTESKWSIAVWRAEECYVRMVLQVPSQIPRGIQGHRRVRFPWRKIEENINKINNKISYSTCCTYCGDKVKWTDLWFCDVRMLQNELKIYTYICIFVRTRQYICLFTCSCYQEYFQGIRRTSIGKQFTKISFVDMVTEANQCESRHISDTIITDSRVAK